MGLTQASLALPLRRVPGKALTRAGKARGFEAVRVPWFDEDALTLALDAGLALGEHAETAQRVVLCLDEPHAQASLVQHALGLDVPLVERVGPAAALETLAQAPKVPTLVLAGGTGLGGAGVAVLLEPGDGVEVEAVEHATGTPLGDGAGDALETAVAGLPGNGPLLAPRGTPGRGALAGLSEGVTGRVGRVGAAGALAELVEALAREAGPVQVATATQDRAIALETGPGSLPTSRVPDRAMDVSVEAWEALEGPHGVPWSEASQGAYVSREDYDADPKARYGARPLGQATVASATTIQAGPPGEFLRQHAASGPYDVVIVEDADGDRRIHQSAVPPGELAIGDRVTGVLRRLFSMEEQWRYAVKVRPV